MSGSEGPEPRDGRALRSARTREALVAATMATVAAGEEPTPERIAERAGVSERTIFRLFDDLPGLWEAVRAQMGADLSRLIQLGPFEGDVQQRTRELVRRRLAVFDAIAPYRSWVDAREALYPRIREGRDTLDRVLRAQAAQALAPELAGDAASIAPAIDSLLSYESWRYLRTNRGLGPRQVGNLLEAAVLRLVVKRSSR